MNRRRYIGILGASSISALAGCSSGDSQTDATEETDTSTETETTTSSASFDATISAPESLEVGEDYVVTVQVENTGGNSGTYSGDVYATFTYGPEPASDTEWSTEEVELEIPAGETKEWESDSTEITRPLFAYCRLNDGPLQVTEVPESKSPIITHTNLVTEWNSFGDAVENKISEAEAGSEINIASRYYYWVQNQTQSTHTQIRVFDENNERVGIRSSTNQTVTNRNGWATWESYLAFDSTGWGSGTYTAEVLIRDEQNNEVSDAGTVEFELV